MTFYKIKKTKYIDSFTSEDKIVYAELGEEPVKSLLYKNVLMFLDQFEGISADIRTHLPTIKKMFFRKLFHIVCI
jgi:hypothetical protein